MAMAAVVYYQDNEDLPIQGISKSSYWMDRSKLTTPIQYISSLPEDLWAMYSKYYGKNQHLNPYGSGAPRYGPFYYSLLPGPLREKWYWCCFRMGSATNWYPNTFLKWSPNAVVCIYSLGPDGGCSGAGDAAFARDEFWKQWNPGGASYNWFDTQYDPSNGAMSYGSVMTFE